VHPPDFLELVRLDLADVRLDHGRIILVSRHRTRARLTLEAFQLAEESCDPSAMALRMR
jgi:hypothetical protein